MAGGLIFALIVKSKYKYMKKRHFVEVVSIIAIHSLLSWVVWLVSVRSNLIIFTAGLPFVYGIFSAMIFLFIFTHDRVITLARLLEEKEEHVEEKFLKKFKHHSRIFTSLVVGILGGPILGALTTRMLLPRFPYKYEIVIISSIISTLFYLFFLHGVLGWAI